MIEQPAGCTGDVSTCTAGNGDEDGVPCPSCQAENDLAAAEYRKDDLSHLFGQRGTKTGRLKA